MASPVKAFVDPTAGPSLMAAYAHTQPGLQLRCVVPSNSIQPKGFTGSTTVVPNWSSPCMVKPMAQPPQGKVMMQRLGTFPPIYKENPATGGSGGSGPLQGQMYPRLADPTYS